MKFTRFMKVFIFLIALSVALSVFATSAFAATTSVPQYKYKIYVKNSAWGTWGYQGNSYTYNNLTYDPNHGFYNQQEYLSTIYWEEGMLWWKKYYKAEKYVYWYFDPVTDEWLNDNW